MKALVCALYTTRILDHGGRSVDTQCHAFMRLQQQECKA